ncbi:MAG: SDR family NAD(P)-dependent oxidoreductase [bacterium]|nr:SDR family NAD(P)-dependent oxidoreductase [bacterium]
MNSAQKSAVEGSAMRTLTGREPDPIAIVGMGCRFPGDANDPASYWELLEAGVDAISQTPADRWSLQKFYAPNGTLPGKTQSKWGGYVSGIDRFDPQLFGISPREAAVMDPQQRMLLEVAFRAMEDAGQPVNQLAGAAVSVFVGISSFDYVLAGLSYEDRGEINPYSNTGGSSSIAANRISYCFDLRGPSVAVDTACSSSLVAVHMACESIWRGEAEMALAGGVNALIMPDFYVAFSQLGVLSPDGRCKSFDARANGYVRSEGAGMVLLKPLQTAIRDGDSIYAVIRSTALNQDGRTPGMTVPSQEAQERLIRRACEKARVRPADIQYVEAHGTGTPVGDPIEANALGSVLSQAGRERPCTIGSVKTNIGHLEAGAGIASLIKVALCLQHRRIPGLLHFQKANPGIDFEALGLRIPRHTEDWHSEVPRLAGINGFGYGGANAHVILAESPVASQTQAAWPAKRDLASTNLAAPDGDSVSKVRKAEAARAEASRSGALAAPVLLPLSARSKSALADYSAVMADWVDAHPEFNLAEVAGYLAHRRSHLEYRATACASTTEDMVNELRALAQSAPEEFISESNSERLEKGLVFVCSGQGPQWWAMGRGLLKYSPAFRSVIKRCDAEFSKYGSWSLMQELTCSEAASRMQQTSIAQPSLFAIQVALAAVWESWGIKPSAVVGHSVGEIAAAYLSGGLSWTDACRVAFFRGRTMDLATSHGGMVAAGLSPDEVPQWISGMESLVGIAAINGPSSVTISGDRDAIDSLTQRLETEGVFCRKLAVEYAFHSPQMEPVRGELLEALSNISPRATRIPLISTVTGDLLPGQSLDAEYWWKNVRQSVRFSDAMSYLAKQGYGVAVELGPHPVLAYAINECFQACGESIHTVPSLNRQQDDLLCISKSLGNLYSLGFDIDWSGFYKRPTRKLPVVAFPFQLQPCWSESFESKRTRLANLPHPLLGEACDGIEARWQSRIDLKLYSYLEDHRVRQSCVYPAAAMIETALAAASCLAEKDSVRVERIRLHKACVLTEQRPQWIETRFRQDRRQLEFSVRACDDDDWDKLATMTVSGMEPRASHAKESGFSKEKSSIESRCVQKFDGSHMYRFCEESGLSYGSRFRGLVSGSRRSGESLCTIRLGNRWNSDWRGADYFFHPALLDSCFHAMIAADESFDARVEDLYLPSEIAEFNFYRRPTEMLSVHARMRHKSNKSMVCDLDIYDEEDRLCVEVRGFKSVRVSNSKRVETTADLIYSYSWQEQALDATQLVEQGAAKTWLLFMDERGLGQELSQRLKDRGDEVVEVYREDSLVAQTDSAFYQVDPESLESFVEALQAVCDGEKRDVVDHVVYLWGLDAPATQVLTSPELDRSTILTTLAPMHLIQAWDQLSGSSVADLKVVTCGAQSADGSPESVEVAQAPLIGFARVIVSEYSRLRTKLVDLPAGCGAMAVENLLQEVLSSDDEDEVLWRDGRRFVHRFTSHPGKLASTQAKQELACQLRNGSSAGIEELHYETKPSYQLGPQEVEIEVLAAGLNFSDVMKALDLYPGLPDGPVELGAECSGRIVQVGSGSRWKVGDEVIAIAPGSFSTRVKVHEALVARKPRNLTHEQAAAIPVAFLTADYALNECARIRAGESVLIHAASGGVGLAAMQLASIAGAKILATAGNDEKRDFVRQLGAEKVMDSRSLKFSDEVLEFTGGVGVDAVLNSLPGEAIAKGLAALKRGGRFLEIGKRDIYDDASLGLYPFRNNLALFAIDLDQLFKSEPLRMGRMLEALVPRFESGELKPLPVMTYPARASVEAFRWMQQGKHIGKVVIEYSEAPDDVREGAFDPMCLEGDGTYWIAGGLGGFGLQIAAWLAEKGAKNLVLSGRSRQLSAVAERTVQKLRSQGVRVEVMPTDITEQLDVRNTCQKIADLLPPLKGVFHTAMVLEDRLLTHLDRPTLERVLRPKVLGGWNLHEETKNLDLDLFVLFSSLSSVFGHAGQANYSAANAALDSLAYYRRSLGLPATVMNWGHLGEVGYLAEREQLGQRLERQGVLSFSVGQATECLEYALQNRSLQLSVLRMDWTRWRGLGITNRVSPRFAHLLQQSDLENHDSATLPSAATLRTADMERRRQLVLRLVRHKAGALLGISAEAIPADRPLLEMGLDSLMAVEMRNWIESQVEIDLPISSLMRGSSLSQVVDVICDIIGHDSDLESNETASEEVATKMKPVSNITEEDAESLLEQLPDMDPEEVKQLLQQVIREND